MRSATERKVPAADKCGGRIAPPTRQVPPVRLPFTVVITATLAAMLTCDVALAERPAAAWLRSKVRDALLRRIEQRSAERWQTALAAGNITRYRLVHAGRDRQYFVHLPPTASDGKKLPLLVALHGGTGCAQQLLASYDLIAAADRHGFILVAPDGTGPSTEVLHAWNVGFGFGAAETENVDDVGFVLAVIEAVRRRHPVDPARIFATGISNGGMLCHWLAAAPGTPLAAIAPVVATVGGCKIGSTTPITPPRPTRPVSVLAINGRLDRSVPLAGGRQLRSVGEARILLSASDTVAFWVAANGCAATPTVTVDATRQVTLVRHGNGRDDTEVILVILENQGHAWPGAPAAGRRGADQPVASWHANDEMWTFFRRHPRRDLRDAAGDSPRR